MIERKPRNTAETLIWRFIDAQNSHDYDAATSLLAEDFVRHGEETNWGPLGRKVFEEWLADFSVAFPDWGWDVLDMTSSDHSVGVLLIEFGTFSSPWELRGRTIQPNQKRYEERVAIFFEINEDNLIQSYTNIHTSAHFIECYGDLLDDPSIVAAMPEQQ